MYIFPSPLGALSCLFQVYLEFILVCRVVHGISYNKYLLRGQMNGVEIDIQR